MNSLAIFREIFTPLALNLTNELYKQRPAKTVGQKVLKQRLIRNIERKEFARMINAEKKTVELWELHELVPSAKSIKKICELFEIPLEYFGLNVLGLLLLLLLEEIMDFLVICI